jgi:hypothetical protein
MKAISYLIRAGVVAGVGVALPFTALADDLASVSNNAQTSVTIGFSGISLPLLSRVSVADPTPALLAQVCPAPCQAAAPASHNALTRISGPTWHLDVSVDGTWARFEDLSVRGRAHSLGVNPSAKMTASSLVSTGQAYVAAHLSPVLPLGQGEQMIPLRVSYRTDGGQDLTTKEITRVVVANTIVFGRTVNGAQIVGGGSTITLSFTNDGALEFFQYDWPSYSQSTNQSLEPIGQLLNRLQEVVSKRSGVAAPTAPMAAPTGSTSPYPLVIASNTMLDEFECGYFDSGDRKHNAALPVQAGCLYHALWQHNGLRAGLAGAVPGAVTVLADSSWPEANIIRGDVVTASAPPASAP